MTHVAQAARDKTRVAKTRLPTMNRLNVVCHAATWSPVRPPEVLPHEPIAIYIAIRSDSLTQSSVVTQAYTLNGLREILDCQ
jgi:hypothetical protein